MTTRAYPFAAARIFNTPLLVHPVKGEVIARALAARLGIAGIEHEGPVVLAGDWFDDDEAPTDSPEPDRGYDLIDGIACIDVSGVLVHRNGYLRPSCGILGYDGIRQTWLNAIEDDRVRAIAAICNSPGGEVSGCFELVDFIHASRELKPSVAILDDMAFSACYAIASACDQVTVPRTGGTGSVGVIAMHADFSKRLAAEGVKVTIFQYGERKADGSEFFPLSKEAAARFQSDIDELGRIFVDTVARNRGLTTAAVRATQAGTYLGAAGVGVGFADAVAAPAEAFQSLLAQLG